MNCYKIPNSFFIGIEIRKVPALCISNVPELSIRKERRVILSLSKT